MKKVARDYSFTGIVFSGNQTLRNSVIMNVAADFGGDLFYHYYGSVATLYTHDIAKSYPITAMKLASIFVTNSPCILRL